MNINNIAYNCNLLYLDNSYTTRYNKLHDYLFNLWRYEKIYDYKFTYDIYYNVKSIEIKINKDDNYLSIIINKKYLRKNKMKCILNINEI